MFHKRGLLAQQRNCSVQYDLNFHSYLKSVVSIVFCSINCSSAAEHDKYGNFRDAYFNFRDSSKVNNKNWGVIS